MVDWTPVERSSVEVVGVDPKSPDRLKVRVRLTRDAGPVWFQFVLRDSNVATPDGMEAPQADGPAAVMVRVPDDEIERHVRHIDHLIEAANERWEKEVLPALRADEERANAKKQQTQQRVDEAQRRADEL